MVNGYYLPPQYPAHQYPSGPHLNYQQQTLPHPHPSTRQHIAIKSQQQQQQQQQYHLDASENEQQVMSRQMGFGTTPRSNGHGK